jgi:hypothetical protein
VSIIIAVENNQIWRRKIDQKALVVSLCENGAVCFYEYGNPQKTGWKSNQCWHEECNLMGIDELVETGGVF